MSRGKAKLKRFHVAGLPLIREIAQRMNLRTILYRHIGTHGNEVVPAVESLMLLIFNLTLGKDPLYELEDWVSTYTLYCSMAHFHIKKKKGRPYLYVREIARDRTG